MLPGGDPAGVTTSSGGAKDDVPVCIDLTVLDAKSKAVVAAVEQRPKKRS